MPHKFFFTLPLSSCIPYSEFKSVHNEYSGIKVLYISQMIHKAPSVTHKIHDCNPGLPFFETCINLIGNERSSSSTKVMLCNIGCGLSQSIFIQGDQVNLSPKLSTGITGSSAWSETLSHIASFGIIIFFSFFALIKTIR